MAPPVSYGMKFTLQQYQAAINYIKLCGRSFLCKKNNRAAIIIVLLSYQLNEKINTIITAIIFYNK